MGVGQFLRDGCFMFTILVGACLLATISCQAPDTPPEATGGSKPTPQLAVPSAEKRSVAALEISKKFGAGGDELARLDRQVLAQELFRAAEATKDTPAMHYVLLDRATDEAVRSGDIETLLKALGHLSKGYKGDWLAIRMQKLKTVGPVITWPR